MAKSTYARIGRTYDVFLFRYDDDRDHKLNQLELQRMMEKLDAPQTHLGLKAMIREIDEDQDGAVSFREVSSCLLIAVFKRC